MHNESGCTGEIRVRQVHLEAPISNVDELQAIPTGYELHFGPGPRNPDGTFQHGALPVRHSDRGITESGESLGGQFSTLDDSSGNPRMVAGTYGGTASTAGESEVAFIGAFYGSTELLENRPAQPTNVPPMMPAPGN